jgi:hypothetical protein
MKWPHAAAHTRPGSAGALATITPALATTAAGRPPAAVLRAALYAHAYNPSRPAPPPGREPARALAWAERHSLRRTGLTDPQAARRALDALKACHGPGPLASYGNGAGNRVTLAIVTSKGRGVDPAALLISVFAVGLALIDGSGSWNPLNTIVSLLALLVLWAYVLDSDRGRSVSECLAVASVIGLVSVVTFGWPMQAIFGIRNSLTAAYWAMAPAAFVAIAIFTWQVYREKKRHRAPQDSGTDLVPALVNARDPSKRRGIEISFRIRRL